MPFPPLPPAFRNLTPIGASPAPLEPDQAGDSQAPVDDPSQAPTAEETQGKHVAAKKPKRVRLLLDKVTELSDDEMKVCYLSCAIMRGGTDDLSRKPARSTWRIK